VLAFDLESKRTVLQKMKMQKGSLGFGERLSTTMLSPALDKNRSCSITAVNGLC